MKRPGKVLFIGACVASLSMLGGCAYLTPQEAQYTNAKTYPDTREAVWGRILSMSAHNAMIVKPDNVNGIIDARREISTPKGDTVYNWADCGWGGVFARPVTQHVEVHYLVQKDPTGTKVVVNTEFKELRVNIASQKSTWVTCASTGVLEEELLDALWGV
jgi:hypothetical protein